MSAHPTVSLVIPVFNETRTLAEILRRIVAVDFPKELVIVDDCSTDGSREFLELLHAQGLSALPDAKPKNVTSANAGRRLTLAVPGSRKLNWAATA